MIRESTADIADTKTNKHTKMASPIRLLDGKALGPDASAAEQAAFCDALIEGFSNQGMVKLINHGIPDEDIEGIFRWVSPITIIKQCPLLY